MLHGYSTKKGLLLSLQGGGVGWPGSPPPRKKPHKPHLHLSKAALAAPSTIDHRKTEPAT